MNFTCGLQFATRQTLPDLSYCSCLHGNRDFSLDWNPTSFRYPVPLCEVVVGLLWRSNFFIVVDGRVWNMDVVANFMRISWYLRISFIIIIFILLVVFTPT